MNEAEFDQYAEHYESMMRENIAVTGEGPEYFARYKILDTRLICDREGIEPETILDFGSGIGASTPFFAELFPSSRKLSADVSEKSLEFLQSRYPNFSEPVHISHDRIPLTDSSVALVFTACVFHHIPANEHIHWLKEIRRVLKPNGMFVLFEHNPLNPLTVRAVNTCPFDENAVLIPAKTMMQRLMNAGFSASEKRYRIFFPSVLSALRPIEKALTWLPLGGQYSLAAKA